MRVDWRDIRALLRRALQGWVDDGASTMGASLAFYTLFSLAPLMLVAIGVAGFFAGRDEAQAALIGQVAHLIGDQAAVGVEDLLDRATKAEEGIIPAIVGFATLLFGATTVFAELRADLDRIWRYKPARPPRSLTKLLLTRSMAFLLVAFIGLLLMASMLATTFISTVSTRLIGHSAGAMHGGEFALSFIVMTLLFAMIYKILPSTRLDWRDVWLGAAITSALFWVGKFLIALYIAHAGVDSNFGAAGTLVLVIVWVYYSAQVFFFGAELTKEFALRHGSKQAEKRRLRKPLEEMRAANDESHLIDRAKAIVAGQDRAIRGRIPSLHGPANSRQ
jgi:membrane protein